MALLLIMMMSVNPVLATPGTGAHLLLIGSQSAESAWSMWKESYLYREYSLMRYGSARGQAPKGWDGKGAPRQPKPPTVVPETKADRERKVATIKLFPGDVTIQTGEQVFFNAIAYDKEGSAVGGLDVKWEGFDEENKKDVIVSQTAGFSSSVPGKFKLTAEITGRKASAFVTVIGDERKPGVRGETEEPVSSADKPKSKSASLGPVNTPRDAAPRNNKVATVEASHALRAAGSAMTRTAAVFLGMGEDATGWNSDNFTTVDDAGKERGSMPGRSPDGGVGSGNFQFSAPLLGFEGRGIDLNLAFNYNSRLWHKSGNEMYFDVDRDWIAGWMFGFGKIVMAGSSYVMIDADGTRHPYSGISRANFPSPYSSLQTYEAYTTDGSFINYYAEGYHGGFNNSNGHNLFTAWAKLPNGTTISYGARANYAIYPTRITDANGNYITITYRTYTRTWAGQTYYNVQEGPFIETITDTLGRTIQFHYERTGVSPNEKDKLTAVTAPNLGNGPRRVLLRIQYDTKNLSAAGGNYGFQGGLTPRVRDNGVVDVIKAIYYPATNTGYWFGDADSYSPYGMIRKVSERRGMTCTVGGVDCGYLATQASLTQQPSIGAGLVSRDAAYTHPSQPGYSYPHIYGALSDTPTYTQMTEEWAGRATSSAPLTKYSVVDIGSIRRTTIVRPDGVRLEQDIDNTPGSIYNGLLIEDRTYPSEFSTTVIHSSSVDWYRTDPAADPYNNDPTYCSPRPTRTEVIDDRGQMTATEYSYGPYYNQVESKIEYGYGGVRLHRGSSEYENDLSYRGSWVNRGTLTYDYGTYPDWSGPHLFNLVKENSIYAADDVTRMAHVRTRYDETGLVARGDAGQLAYVPAQRGNPTSIRRYSNAVTLDDGTAVVETRAYDACGNIVTQTTACCEQTTFEYDVNSRYAWPTVIRRGSSSAGANQNVVSFGIDFYTGLALNSTDANGRTSDTYYNSSLRPEWEYNGSAGYAYHLYSDVDLIVYDFTYESGYSGGDFSSRSDKYIDGHGRVHGEVAYGKDYVLDLVLTQYDNLGRLWRQTRPYRSTPEWTVSEYDALDRHKKVTAPDGSVVERFYNESGSPSAAFPGAPGQTVRGKDPWGRERWARFDEQNRLVEVVEPDPNGNGAVASNGLRTEYSYDALGNLLQVSQGNQLRNFKYDSLSRLTHQKLAERDATLNDAGAFVATRSPSLPVYSGGQWSDVFFYDTRSNLTQRVDSRGVRTYLNYNNDPLNRLQSIQYDKSGAPANLQADFPILDAANVTYTYLTSGDKTRIQNLTMSNGVGNQSFSYLSNGLSSQVSQTFPGKESYPLTTAYTWDTLDRLKSLQYPVQYGTSTATPKVEPSYDIASRTSSLKFGGTTFASNPVYNAESQVESMGVGGFKTEFYTYDPKTGLLLSQQVKQGATVNLQLGYNYTLNYDANNNGPKTGQLTRVFDPGTSYLNRYNFYDALGRLKESSAGSDPANPLWKQTYTYDRYGNRTSVTKSGPGSASVPLDGLASLNFANSFGRTLSNRITTAGYEYDPTGNQTRGQIQNGTWMRYRYDSAGRLAEARNDSNSLLETYNYGASNQRLSTDYIGGGGGPSTYYAWEGGQVIAEYRANIFSSSLGWDKYYVYLGGRLLATSEFTGGTKYYHPDRLGTRVVSDASTGSITTSQTNLPYGMALDTSGTALTRRFTSYDRSATTGMDYAVNRFYNSAQGRFTQVDPIELGATSLSDPQTLNLYGYCRNDPINRVDPDGLFWKWIGKAFKAIGKALANKWVQLAIAVAFAILSAGSSAFIIHNLAIKITTAGIGVVETTSITAAGWGAIGLLGAQATGGAVSAFSQRRNRNVDQELVARNLRLAINDALAALRRSNACRKLLRANGMDPERVLSGLQRKERFSTQDLGNRRGVTVDSRTGRSGQGRGLNAAIIMDDVNLGHDGMASNKEAKILDPRISRAVTVLHETGHATGAVPFHPDYGHAGTFGGVRMASDDPNRINNMISRACFP